MKAQLRNTLYSPASWPTFSVALQALYEGNVTEALLAFGDVSNPGVSLASTPEANFGIRGVDKTVRTPSLAGMQPAIEKILANSQSMGDISAIAPIVVQQWKKAAVEIYEGDFKVKTRHPVLLTSNTWDPLAPLEAAEQLEDLLEDSVLLANDGYGVSGHS
jgi:hypothetical protein